MEYEKVTGSIFDLKDAFEAGELFGDIDGSGDSDYFYKIEDEDEFIENAFHKTLYRQANPKKTYKGVELPGWAVCLTWDKNGSCYCWCEQSFRRMSYTAIHHISLSYGGVCDCIKELNVEPFLDGSWKDSLIKL